MAMQRKQRSTRMRDATCADTATREARPKTLNVDVFLTLGMSIDPSKTIQRRPARCLREERRGLAGPHHEYKR